MKKLMYSLTVAALFSAATMASANDLPYEQDNGIPDDPVPTEDAVDLGGSSGLTQGTEATGLDGFLIQIDAWASFLVGYIVTLPNRDQIIG